MTTDQDSTGSRPVALVTGAAGFIGAHLVRELVRLDRCDVVALDDMSGGFKDNVPGDIPLVEGSIVDHRLIGDLFDHYSFRYVFHLAAYAAEGLSHFIRRFNYTNNLVGSINLINQSIKHRTECFVFTSSIAVYGTGQVPMTEEMIPQPEDPYGIAKYAVESDLRAAHDMFGLKYVIVRPHNVYGEYQNIGDRYRNVVGIFMRQILDGEPMSIFGDGEQERAFSYVGDTIGPIASAPWTPGAQNGVFNVGADVPYTVNELSRQVAASMGVPRHPVVHLEPRNEVRVAYSDHSAVRTVFGGGPETALADGLARMASWVRGVGPRKSSSFEAIEVEREMPASWREAMAVTT